MRPSVLDYMIAVSYTYWLVHLTSGLTILRCRDLNVILTAPRSDPGFHALLEISRTLSKLC